MHYKIDEEGYEGVGCGGAYFNQYVHVTSTRKS